jgi:predicted small lipoprotein YifL
MTVDRAGEISPKPCDLLWLMEIWSRPLPRSQRPIIPLGLIVAISAALVLSACGRKGPLDLPPGASAIQQQPAAAAPSQDSAVFPDYDEQGRPIAPQGQKRRIPLDVLID